MKRLGITIVDEALKMSTLVLESMTEGVSISDEEGYIVYTNPAEDQIFGYERGELIGQHVTVQNSYPEEENKELVTQVIEQLRLQGAWKGEWNNKKKDGTRFITFARITAIELSGKKYWVCVQEDITERKRIETQLREREQTLNLALEAGRIGVWEWNIEQNNISWSNEVYSIHEVQKESTVTRFEDYQHRIHPEDRERVVTLIQDALEKKVPYEAEFRVFTPKQNTRWVHTRGMVIYNEQERPVKMLGATMDITNRVMLEKQKDEFLAVASHELKTPLTSIKAYTQILFKRFQKNGNHEESQLVSKLDSQLNRLTGLISDLLDVSKIQSGKLQFSLSAFDINELVDEVIEQLQLTTETHTLVKEGQVTQLVYADRERTGQVITNLLTNAIKYSPQATSVLIKLSEQGNNAHISVTDFGIGIAEEKQGRLFERFYRVDGTATETFPGLGLGLYISAEIVQRLGGTISVQSKEQAGSTFSFTVPLGDR